MVRLIKCKVTKRAKASSRLERTWLGRRRFGRLNVRCGQMEEFYIEVHTGNWKHLSIPTDKIKGINYETFRWFTFLLFNIIEQEQNNDIGFVFRYKLSILGP